MHTRTSCVCACVADGVLALMLHPHSWVRLYSARLFGLLFAAYSPEEIIQSIMNGGQEEVAAGRRRNRRKMKSDGGSSQFLLQNTIFKVLLQK